MDPSQAPRELGRLRALLGEPRPAHSVPLSLHFDRRGRRLRLCRLGARDLDRLAQMYRDFDPEQGSLGVPPRGESRLRAWVEQLFAQNVQLIAKEGRRVAAHAAWIRDDAGGAEVLVFVHPDYQGAGLGKKMLAAVITMARFMGVDRLWSEVENHNVPVIRMNRDLGFETRDWHGGTREMELRPDE